MMTIMPKIKLPLPYLKTNLGTLYEGDCLEILGKIDTESQDLVFADPPFNLGKEYRSKMNDSVADEEYLEWCKSWVSECSRVLKPGGSLFLYNLPKWNLLLGPHTSQTLTFRHWISIDMKYTLPIQKRLYPSHYSLLYFIKGKKPAVFHPDRIPLRTCRHCGGEQQDYGGYKNKMNPEGVNLSDVWTDIPPVRHSKYKSRTANQLSLKLMDRIIKLATNEGDNVLDPFGGAGTTYAACELLNRRWTGIELHCEDIRNRFDEIEEERDHLRELQKNQNVLFSHKAIRLRMKHGLTNNKFRMEQSLTRAGVAEKDYFREKNGQSVLKL